MVSKHSSRNDLVVDGVAAVSTDYPFAAYIRTNILSSSGQSCIGAILTNEHIMTESICVINPKTNKPLPLEEIEVSYGNSSRTHQIPATLVDIIYDDGYDKTNYTNSVALIKVEPLTFSNSVNRIPIYNKKLRLDDKLISVSWGGVNNTLDGTDIDNLLSYNQKIGNDHQCRQALDNYQGPNGRVICTFNSEYADKNVCNGGGIGKLLLKEIDKKWLLVGISTNRKYQEFFKEGSESVIGAMEICNAKYTEMDFIRTHRYISSFSSITGLDSINFTSSVEPIPEPKENDSDKENESNKINTPKDKDESSKNSNPNSGNDQDNSNNDHDQEPNSSSNTHSSASNGLSTGSKIGIIVGSIALLLIIVVTSYILYRAYKKNRAENTDRQHYENGVRHVAREFGILERSDSLIV